MSFLSSCLSLCDSGSSPAGEMWEAVGKSPDLHTGAVLDRQNPNSPTSWTRVYEWVQPRSAKPDPAGSRPSPALPEESKMLWHQICNMVVWMIISPAFSSAPPSPRNTSYSSPQSNTLSSVPKRTEPWTEVGKSQCQRPSWTQASSSDCKSCCTVVSSALWLCAYFCPWLVRSPRMQVKLVSWILSTSLGPGRPLGLPIKLAAEEIVKWVKIIYHTSPRLFFPWPLRSFPTPNVHVTLFPPVSFQERICLTSENI